jgi:hypothetical protein
MRTISAAIIGIVAILAFPSIGGAITQGVNYQGRLTDGSGTPVTVATVVEFRLFDVSSGGVELWMESQTVAPDPDGLFSVELGSAIPIPDSALAVDEAWLEIKVDTDPPLSPRTRLSAAPYSRVASSMIGEGPLHLSQTDVSSGDSGSVETVVSADSGVTEITTAHNSSGQATGKRQHKPVVITKEWGATNGTATAEMKSMVHADSGFAESWSYATPDATVEGHENGHSFGHGHLDYLKRVGDPATAAAAEQKASLEADSGVIESTTAESTTGTATGKRVHRPFRIITSSMTTTSSDTAFWQRTVDVDSGCVESTYVAQNGDIHVSKNTTGGKGTGILDRFTAFSGDTATFEALLAADSGYHERAAMNKADLVAEISHGVNQTREHILLSRQVGSVASPTTTSIEMENTGDGPQITMTKQGTAGDPSDDGVVILNASVPGGLMFGMVTYGDTAATTTASSDKRKQSLYFPESLHSALDLLVDGTVSMIILKKLNVASGGVDSNVVIDNNGDVQLAGQLSVGGSQGTVADASTFTVPRISTSQRDGIAAVNGMIVYNTTTHQFNFYENGAWVTK